MKFTHLHIHSHYSLLDGLPKIDDLLNYTQELGMDSVALTDHGVMYGAVEFYKKAKKQGIKPIIGCEVYLAFENMLEKRANIDNKIFHLILLVKNETGYQNLVKLVTKAQLEGFYYKPRVDEALLTKHSEGLIALSACIQGRIPRTIINGKIEEAADLAKKYQKIFGLENFYLEIQNHPNLKGQNEANQCLIDFSKKLNLPLVLTNDCHYLRKEDSPAQDVLMLINTGAKPDDPERLTMQGNDFSMTSPKEVLEFCQKLNIKEAFDNTQIIAEKCNFEFELGKTKLPKFATPEKETLENYIKKLCLIGLEKKKDEFDNLATAQERLNYELAVIEKTGFASYFLIVQDFVNWAKQNRIVVGPGRGSAGGSLVAYLLNITEVNPLKHGLLFERFLNPERISMPDIDLDFTDRRRNEVLDYVAKKYGSNHVAQIITFGTMASRAVIRDVGRALHYEYNYCDKIAKMIPFGFDLSRCLADVAEFRQLYQTDSKAKDLIDFAKKLEGVARHASTHACGVVISAEPLDSQVPLQYPTQTDKTIVTQYEMHSIEDLGLLKMDFLGLKNLTIIEDTLARIYKVQGKSLDLSKIDYNDKKTIKLFQAAKTTSVFQLESAG
ncbi:DNA polymerase III subunit alpha, partial [Candidatus Gribaldobacteria bacterium]|nr:DNA polymerase III subunit alpha [Candidatus Gribaldobacteria bacterium]